jgi:hypothetical protein
MSDAVYLALIALVPSVIGIGNRQKLGEIHILVNSNLTAVKTALAEANIKIERLEGILGSLNKEKP